MSHAATRVNRKRGGWPRDATGDAILSKISLHSCMDESPGRAGKPADDGDSASAERKKQLKKKLRASTTAGCIEVHSSTTWTCTTLSVSFREKKDETLTEEELFAAEERASSCSVNITRCPAVDGQVDSSRRAKETSCPSFFWKRGADLFALVFSKCPSPPIMGFVRTALFIFTYSHKFVACALSLTCVCINMSSDLLQVLVLSSDLA